jgi:hypothetical protein
VRGLWLLDKEGNVLLSRRFSTVERRVRLRHEAPLLLEPEGEPEGRAANKYFFYDEIAVPHDEEFSKIFKDDFLDHFHHNSSPEYPIFGLQRRQGSDASSSESMSDLVLWPTVILHRLDIFLVLLPEVDGFPIARVPEERPRAIQLPCVTASFAMLESLVSFVSPCAPQFANDKLAILQCQISSMMPFGTPIETDVRVINEIHAKGFADSETNVQKRPAWKPYILLNSKQKLRLHVREEVRAMQYGRVGIDDVWKLRGTITCDAQLNGVPRVSLPLNRASMLTDLIVDNCALPPAEIDSKLIIFTPPNRQIELCRYNFQLPVSTKLPVFGTYRVTEVSPQQIHVDLRVNMGLSAKFQGLLTECSVLLPWQNRTRISSHALVASHGSVVLAGEENELVWNIGRKFADKEGSCVLKGTVTFAKRPKLSPATTPTAPSTSLVGPGIDTGVCTGDEQAVPLPTGEREWISPSVLPDVTDEDSLYVSLPAGQGYDTFAQNSLKKKEARKTWTEYAKDDMDGSESGLLPIQSRRRNNPMLVGLNCYAQLNFHLSNYTLSGLTIDKNAVSIEPSSQGTAINIEANVATSEFLIWNSAEGAESQYAVAVGGESQRQ